MRVVFFGMTGRLAGPALRALLAAGAEVGAVAVPGPPGAPPVAQAPLPAAPRGMIALGPAVPPGPLVIAAERGLPALALRSMGAPAVREAVAALAPDLAVVACWPWRIPAALLAVPRLGFLNLHPSPLPELRGPEPLFWALQEGRRHTAVTLHWMDEGLDTGDIAAAAPLELPEGAGWAELEDRAAGAGAALLSDLLPRLAAWELPRRPQGPGGSYRPAPAAADFTVEQGWPAARAFSFMRGTAAWGLPYSLAGSTLRLGAALAYEPEGSLGAPLVVEGGTARVQMTPGVLTVTLAE
jgi:methionyl-tRNA formyltransferase